MLHRVRRRGLVLAAAALLSLLAPAASALLSLLAPAASALTPASGGSRPLAGRVVHLDAGHDGGNAAQPARARALVPAGGFRKPCNTTGTSTDSGYAEHAFTFDVVARAAALLRAQGATVVLSRASDTGFGPCVDRRAAIGNLAHADAAISVHADGALSSGRGFHVIAAALAPDGGNAAMLARSYRLALAVRAAFRTGTGEQYATYTAHQGLTRRSDLAGLNLSRVPTVFIECGNMRNPGDAQRMRDPVWRQSAARALVSSLNYLRR
ncbi:MAG: N-acetylmuramoyl-L-alanine amidase [Actinomycetota bacterium]